MSVQAKVNSCVINDYICIGKETKLEKKKYSIPTGCYL